MKVLQVPFHYYPDAVGGTEVYTSSLARCLRGLGVDVEIAAPGLSQSQYTYDDIQVHRFGVTKMPTDVAMLYGDGDPEATRQFAQILDRTAPDLVHLHAMSPAVSLNVLREIKRRRVPVIFTCHIPGITCSRGTLLDHGKRVCDGVWALHRCSSCVLESKGLPMFLARSLGVVPTAVGRSIRSLGHQGPIVTMLRMTELQALRQSVLVKFMDEVDQIVAVSAWSRDVLIANGTPSWKVVLCRHGTTQQVSMPGNAQKSGDNGNLKVAFIGRLIPAKGLHLVIEALLSRRQLPIALDVYGIVQDDAPYVERLRRRSDSDTRIRFLPALANHDVATTLRAYDVLAVPSQGLETGPLVVYDAFSAGLPVIGSRRGGIAELVHHDLDGLLVEPSDVNAWADAFERLCGESGLLTRLRAAVQPGRKMSVVASDMLVLYTELTARQE